MEGGVSTLVRAFGCGGSAASMGHRRCSEPGTRVQGETSEPTPTGIIARIGSSSASRDAARQKTDGGARHVWVLPLAAASSVRPPGPLPNLIRRALRRIEHRW